MPNTASEYDFRVTLRAVTSGAQRKRGVGRYRERFFIWYDEGEAFEHLNNNNKITTIKIIT